MEHADVSMLLEALTGGTSAERFGECLAAPPSAESPAALPFAASVEMPLVAAHQPPADPLSPPPAFFPGSAFDLNVLPATCDYALPVSAVTGNSAASSRSDPAIHKKRARPAPSPVKPKPESVMAVTAAAAAAIPMYPRNVSAMSDVSSRTHRDSSSPASRNFSSESVKAEPKAPSVKAESKTVPLKPQSTPSPGPARSPMTPLQATVPAASPTLPKSHTRKCREKVTKQFEHLLEVLPRPPKGVEVKHKAQILEYTIKIFRYLLLRRTSLNTEIALASKTALRTWMNNTIASASAVMSRDAHAPQKPVPLSAILEPFVGLYCVKNGWPYGEMWLVDPESLHASLESCVFNTDDNNVLRRFDSFATISRSRFGSPAPVRTGMISRVLASRRPEWLCDLPSDPSVFDRAELARENGMSVATAIPVMLDTIRCAGVLVFADVEPHEYSTSDLTTLLEYTSTLGSLYVQYVSSFVRHGSSPGAQDGNMDIKPVVGGHMPDTSPDQSGVLPRRDGEFGCRAPGMDTHQDGIAPGLIRPSSETSYFGDAEFLGN